MNDTTIVSLLSDVSNFNLAIFGISITVFTVLYAFILSRKDSLRDLNDLIKLGNATPFIVQRVAFFANHTKHWKELNNHLRNIVALSIVLFFVGMGIKYAPLNGTSKNLAFCLFGFTLLLAVYILVVLVLVFKNYHRTTNIK